MIPHVCKVSQIRQGKVYLVYYCSYQIDSQIQGWTVYLHAHWCIPSFSVVYDKCNVHKLQPDELKPDEPKPDELKQDELKQDVHKMWPLDLLSDDLFVDKLNMVSGGEWEKSTASLFYTHFFVTHSIFVSGFSWL